MLFNALKVHENFTETFQTNQVSPWNAVPFSVSLSKLVKSKRYDASLTKVFQPKTEVFTIEISLKPSNF